MNDPQELHPSEDAGFEEFNAFEEVTAIKEVTTEVKSDDNKNIWFSLWISFCVLIGVWFIKAVVKGRQKLNNNFSRMQKELEFIQEMLDKREKEETKIENDDDNEICLKRLFNHDCENESDIEEIECDKKDEDENNKLIGKIYEKEEFLREERKYEGK